MNNTRLVASLGWLLIAFHGLSCSKEEPPPRPVEADHPTSDDPNESPPPESWEPFLSWATARLQVTPSSVALPKDPKLATLNDAVIHIDERLRSTNSASEEENELSPRTAIASLGPCRSDQPSSGCEVLDGGDGGSLAVRLSGFRVARENVGRVVVAIRIPWGRHVDLAWSAAGRLRLPIPDNNRVWTLSVTTAGFADWQGPLDSLLLVADGTGDGAIEIRSLELLAQAESFTRPYGRERVQRKKETRNALYIRCPGQASVVNVSIPPRATLDLGLNLLHPTPDESESEMPDRQRSATLEVLVQHGDSQTVIVHELLPATDEWHDVSTPLSAFAGKTVAMTFRVSGPDGAVAFLGNPVVYTPVPDPPIVIVYLIDALSAKHIGLHGYHRDTMPNLTALAKQGVWFANMFANSPKTVSSVADLMFSIPTERHGVYHASMRAPLELVSLADAMRSRGFATASFCTNVNAGPRQNADQGFDTFVDRIAYWWTDHADRTVPIDDVLNWLAQHNGRPAFVYIHTAEPHDPYQAPSPFAGRFDTGYRGAIDGTRDPEHGFPTARTPEEIAHVASLYDDECAYADDRLRRFVDALKEKKLWQRVQMFVTSDHGEQFLEHGFWAHGGDLHAETHRVPLVVLGRGVSARGRVDTPVQIHDLMPTVLDLAGVPNPYPLAGTSLRPLLSNSAASTDASAIQNDPARKVLRDRLIFSSNHAYVGQGIVEASVVKDGRWKLMYKFAPQLEGQIGPPVQFLLFDVQSDPGETSNVLDDHHDVARELIAHLVAYRARQHPFERERFEQTELEMDPDQLRELKSLGYIGNSEN